jgi:hypothetical protein
MEIVYEAIKNLLQFRNKETDVCGFWVNYNGKVFYISVKELTS